MIHFFDDDPRQFSEPEEYKFNHGPFSEIDIQLNKALKTLGYYSDLEEAEWVGKCDGLQVGFKYKDKKSFVINVWECINTLPLVLLQQGYGQVIFGLSDQITNLWRKYGFSAETIYGGCDTDFWHPTKPKSEIFTFLHVNSSNVRSGLDLTLKAFDLAFEKNKNVRLIIKDTNNSSKLIEFIKSIKNNGGNIEYVTKRVSSQEIRDLYSSSHVCLNLLRSTSFGMPLLECSACGCLCLTGNTPPTKELIKPEYGVLINPIDQISIKKAIQIGELYGLLNCYPNFSYPEEPMVWNFSVAEYADVLQKIYFNWDYYKKIDTRTPIIENWKWKDQAKKLVKYLYESI